MSDTELGKHTEIDRHVEVKTELVEIRTPLYIVKTAPYRAKHVHVVGEDTPRYPSGG